MMLSPAKMKTFQGVQNWAPDTVTYGTAVLHCFCTKYTNMGVTRVPEYRSYVRSRVPFSPLPVGADTPQQRIPIISYCTRGCDKVPYDIYTVQQRSTHPSTVLVSTDQTRWQTRPVSPLAAPVGVYSNATLFFLCPRGCRGCRSSKRARRRIDDDRPPSRLETPTEALPTPAAAAAAVATGSTPPALPPPLPPRLLLLLVVEGVRGGVPWGGGRR